MGFLLSAAMLVSVTFVSASAASSKQYLPKINTANLKPVSSFSLASGNIPIISSILKIGKSNLSIRKSSMSSNLTSSTFYGNGIWMIGITEYPCYYVNGEWECDTNVHQDYTFASRMEGYPVTTDYANTLAVVYVYEDGNYMTRPSTFTDFSTSPYTTYSIPDEDISILKSDYNGNTLADRYVRVIIPNVITPKGGNFGYTGYVSATNDTYNWIVFEPKTAN